MNFTQSDAHVIHSATGQRMHQDTDPVGTVWSAQDANMIIWSLMQVLMDAGVTPQTFDAGVPASYGRLSAAIQALASQAAGAQILKFVDVPFINVPAGAPGLAGSVVFPEPFPTACDRVFYGFTVDPGGIVNWSVATTAKSAAGVSYLIQEWSASDNPGTLHVMAVGH